MSEHAELLFEADRVRSINDIDVGTNRDDDPSISLSPADSTVSLGGGNAQAGGSIVVNDSSDNLRGVMSVDNGAGSLVVTNNDVDGGIALDGGANDPGIQVFAGSGVLATVENTASGGRATVAGPNLPEDPVAVAESRTGSLYNPPGGYVTVRNSDGEDTVRFDGRDGALVLRGGIEPGPAGGGGEPVYGGGELVIGAKGDPPDLHVHARAEQDSDYGVDTGNRPNVYFDGPNATVELGRATHTGDRGTLSINDDQGQTLLDFRASTGGAGELEFRMNAGGSTVRRGKVEAHPDGLLISMNHPNQPADQWYHTLLVTKRGEVVTKHPIQENVSL